MEQRAFLAKLAATVVALFSIITAIGIFAITRELLLEDIYFVDDFHIVDLLVIAEMVLVLGSAIIVGMWIHRAHSNLALANLPALEFTPGWTIGWYFIPIAALWKPFQAMRELWHASHQNVGGYKDPAPGLLWAWWITWLLAGISSWSDTYEVIDALGSIANAASAILLWLVIDRITKAQPTMNIAGIFE